MSRTNGAKPDPLRVGVIGVGHLGEHHARLFKSLEDEHDVRLVGIMDIDEHRGREISRKYGVNFFPDIDELSTHIDAASVVVPTEDHYAVGKRLIQRGIHCLIEKPMVETLEQAEELYGLSRRKNVLLQVGHIERFNTAFVAARPYIENPRFIEVHRIGPFTERSIDIGVVMDLMIHDIDIILSMVDSPLKEIRSVGASVLTDYEDITNTRLEFENGCVANLTASRVSLDTRREIRIFQERNFINIDYKDQEVKVWELKNGNPNSFDDLEVFSPRVEDAESLRRELVHFIQCIREGKEPMVGGDEGKDAMKVAFEVVEAMKQDNKLNGVHG